MKIINELIESGEKFVKNSKEKYSRHKSWEFCYHKFNNNKTVNTDELGLHLSIYLASWGMYRGHKYI